MAGVAVAASEIVLKKKISGFLIRISESNSKRDEIMAPRKSTTTRRNQIMDAARKLIMRSGSEHVTIRNMAKEVGISEAAIYRHFKSKTEILSFLADNVADGLLNDIEIARSAGFESTNIIDEILKTHLSKIKQKRGIAFLV
ncbi:MAG TPA: TetR/AcrR family transcriptional regulator, partial [Saprospiraceae bacterium]|nr:TetR/AcrR family transcriptional regulator [Saprospiraceae bacterium]